MPKSRVLSVLLVGLGVALLVAALGGQLLGYYEEVLRSYQRNVIQLMGREVAVPHWVPARISQPRSVLRSRTA